MKTLTSILIVTITLATSVFAKFNDKFYQVTDNGKFHYTYWAEDGKENPKVGLKPVTLRTFFLETSRNGLLSGLTFTEFVKLSVEEKQQIITQAQNDIITAMNKTEETITEVVSANVPMTNPNEEKATEETVEAEVEQKQHTQSISIDSNLPWIIRAITNPGSEKNLSTKKVAVTDDKVEVTTQSIELPWIVDAIVNHGEHTTTKNISKSLEFAKTMKVSR